MRLSSPRPETIAEWGRTARFLVVASGSRWARMKAQIVSKDYKAAKQALSAPSSLSLSSDIVGASEENVRALVAALADFATVSGLNDLDEMPHKDLALALERMASSRTAAANLPRIRRLEARFRRAGIGNVIECVGEDISPEFAARAVEHAWLWRVLDDLEFEDPWIAAFDSNTHSRHGDGYGETDRQHRDSTAQRVHRLTAEAIIATMNSYPDETTLIRREAAKKSRHLSVRQLLGRAPYVLSTLPSLLDNVAHPGS